MIPRVLWVCCLPARTLEWTRHGGVCLSEGDCGTRVCKSAQAATIVPPPSNPSSSSPSSSSSSSSGAPVHSNCGRAERCNLTYAQLTPILSFHAAAALHQHVKQGSLNHLTKVRPAKLEKSIHPSFAPLFCQSTVS